MFEKCKFYGIKFNGAGLKIFAVEIEETSPLHTDIPAVFSIGKLQINAGVIEFCVLTAELFGDNVLVARASKVAR